VSFKNYRTYVKSDLFRYVGTLSWKAFLVNILFNPGFRYTFILRTCRYLHHKKMFKMVHLLFKYLHWHYSIRYGISIPVSTEIGYGFYIGHFGEIVINGRSKIGDNVNISHGVTLGQANRGKNMGCPSVGNQVYVGPGAKLVGNVIVGNNVAIGANCVVTKNVPDNAVVVGIPGKIISYEGSEGYVNNIWAT